MCLIAVGKQLFNIMYSRYIIFFVSLQEGIRLTRNEFVLKHSNEKKFDIFFYVRKQTPEERIQLLLLDNFVKQTATFTNKQNVCVIFITFLMYIIFIIVSIEQDQVQNRRDQVS